MRTLQLKLILLFRSVPNDDITLRELLDKFGSACAGLLHQPSRCTAVRRNLSPSSPLRLCRPSPPPSHFSIH
jgi:hypothetical protein